jgi:hypothetical protein
MFILQGFNDGRKFFFVVWSIIWPCVVFMGFVFCFGGVMVMAIRNLKLRE